MGHKSQLLLVEIQQTQIVENLEHVLNELNLLVVLHLFRNAVSRIGVGCAIEDDNVPLDVVASCHVDHNELEDAALQKTYLFILTQGHEAAEHLGKLDDSLNNRRHLIGKECPCLDAVLQDSVLRLFTRTALSAAIGIVYSISR